MNINILQEMLLIEEKSVFSLYKEMMQIAEYFVAPVFTIGLILEYFGQMNFSAVVVKLFIITMFKIITCMNRIYFKLFFVKIFQNIS